MPTTYRATAATLSAVQDAIKLAVDGDTVVIPPGDEVWPNTLLYDKAIILQGSGFGAGGTIIRDGSPGGVDSSGSIHPNTVAGKSYRITNIEFRDAPTAGVGGKHSKGVVGIHGNSKLVRVDHCKFELQKTRCLCLFAYARGVCDHIEFISQDCMHGFHHTWAGGDFGDRSWSTPHTLGTDECWVVEDCTMRPFIAGTNVTGLDAEAGFRMCVRYCTLTDCHQSTHGTEGGQDRSTRQWEIYKNNFVATIRYVGIGQCRGGAGVIWDNVCTGPWQGLLSLHVYRSTQTFAGWGMADGKTICDHNEPGGPFLEGVHNGPDGVGYLQDTTKSWTTDQWRGYTCVNLDSTSRSPASLIEENGTNSTGVWTGGSHDGLMRMYKGNRYQLWKVIDPFDGPGMGDDTGLNRETRAWPNQEREGAYAWNNKINGVVTGFGGLIRGAQLHEGVHFFHFPKPGYTPLAYPHPLVSGTGTTNVAPTFSSLNSATFDINVPTTFQVTAGGTPTPVIAKTTGNIPTGLTLVDNHNGTATLSGTPTLQGTFTFGISATNIAGTANQSFSCTIRDTSPPTSFLSVLWTK